MRQASSDFLRVLCYLYLTKKTRGLTESSTNRIHRSRTGGEGEEGVVGWWGGGVVGGGGAFLSFSFFSFSFSFIFFLSSLSFFVFDVLKGFHFFITLENLNGNILS